MLLIEAGGGPPDPRGPRREPWFVTLILQVLPWPAVVVWLLAGALVTSGWVAVGFAWGAVFVAAWRGSRAIDRSVGGMRDHVQ